jgi:hypothetical protein
MAIKWVASIEIFIIHSGWLTNTKPTIIAKGMLCEFPFLQLALHPRSPLRNLEEGLQRPL